MTYYAIVLLVLYFLTAASMFSSRVIGSRPAFVASFIVALLTFVLAGFRPPGFPDVDTYTIMFRLAATGDFSDSEYWLSHGEPGFKLFSYFISLLGFGERGFLLVCSFLSFVLLYMTSRVSKIPFSYVWFSYFSFYFITRDLGVIRLGIASHLIVLFLFCDGWFRRGVLASIATLSFQAFSFIASATLIINRYRPTLLKLAILLTSAYSVGRIMSIQSFIPLINERQVLAYEGSDLVEAADGSVVTPIIRNVIFSLLLLAFYNRDGSSRNYRLVVWASVLSCVAYLLSINVLIVAQRFAAYFGALVPYGFAYLLHGKGTRKLAFWSVAGVCIANFVSVFYFNDFVWR